MKQPDDTNDPLIECPSSMRNTVFEICAGAGGQSIGLEMAGFELVAAVDNEPAACATLRLNRPKWNVMCIDLRQVDGKPYRGTTLLAGGVPCPPFSIAGKQLGSRDERDLFPEALRLIDEIRPKAVMLENVRGLASNKFLPYRRKIIERLAHLGYEADWRVLNASDFGVPQLRPRFILIAFKGNLRKNFQWPEPNGVSTTVGKVLYPMMSSLGWRGARMWAKKANKIAPTLVGGSKKHGGPDLGPTRARQQWAELSVDGLGLANSPPGRELPIRHIPRLTVPMAALVQGFPGNWNFHGPKTRAYRQVGNAFPPPVAFAVGREIISALNGNTKVSPKREMDLFQAAHT